MKGRRFVAKTLCDRDVFRLGASLRYDPRHTELMWLGVAIRPQQIFDGYLACFSRHAFHMVKAASRFLSLKNPSV